MLHPVFVVVSLLENLSFFSSEFCAMFEVFSFFFLYILMSVLSFVFLFCLFQCSCFELIFSFCFVLYIFFVISIF